jgi:hypothetical protein
MQQPSTRDNIKYRKNRSACTKVGKGDAHLHFIWMPTEVCPACYLLHAGFLLSLFFDPEDDGDMLLRNVA